jgi:hypothetical protein
MNRNLDEYSDRVETLAPTWKIQDSESWDEYYVSVLDFIDNIQRYQQQTQMGPRQAIFQSFMASGDFAMSLWDVLPEANICNTRNLEYFLLSFGPEDDDTEESDHQDETSSEEDGYSDKCSTPSISSESGDEYDHDSDDYSAASYSDGSSGQE